MKYLHWLWQLLMDERGEDDPSGAGAGSEPPAAAGAGNEPPASEGQAGEGEGAGEEPPAAEPKYGEFGDTPTPDQIFEAYGKTKKEFDDFRTKAGLTEKNLAKTRQFLQSVGLVQTEDGRWVMPQRGEQQEKKSRFTDDHKKLFHPQVFSAMDAYIQDKIEEAFSGYGQRQSEQQQWKETVGASVDKMYKFYPQLQEKIDDKPNPDFNKAFVDRATEILNESYRNLPNGDLLAAHEAAMELGISAIAIEKAKKEGHEQGAAGKRVLGTVKSSGGKAPKGRLSREQYLALSSDEREKYDKQGILT